MQEVVEYLYSQGHRRIVYLDALKAIKERGLCIPDDISVMGFDGIEFGRYWELSLSIMVLEQENFGGKRLVCSLMI